MMAPEQTAQIKADYADLRAVARTTTGGATVADPAGSGHELSVVERREVLDDRWAQGGFHFLFPFLESLTDPVVNRFSANYIAGKIRETVEDPATAELLVPGEDAPPVGARRLCIDTDWYETFNRDNVHLVDLNEQPLRDVSDPDADVLVHATGVTGGLGALGRLDIVGRDGQTLQDAWSPSPKTYLGMTVPGLPNLFVLSGPGSPASLVCAPPCAEMQVDWVAGLIGHVMQQYAAVVEPTEESTEIWGNMIRSLAESSLYSKEERYHASEDAGSEFTPFATGLADYGRICEDIADAGYRGFTVECP